LVCEFDRFLHLEKKLQDVGAVLYPRPAPCLRGAALLGNAGCLPSEEGLGDANVAVTEGYLRSLGVAHGKVQGSEGMAWPPQIAIALQRTSAYDVEA
jgi:hypothetical protein